MCVFLSFFFRYSADSCASGSGLENGDERYWDGVGARGGGESDSLDKWERDRDLESLNVRVPYIYI
jgi:hypothetical protein